MEYDLEHSKKDTYIDYFVYEKVELILEESIFELSDPFFHPRGLNGIYLAICGNKILFEALDIILDILIDSS